MNFTQKALTLVALLGVTALALSFTNLSSNAQPAPEPSAISSASGSTDFVSVASDSRAYLHSFNLPGHGVAIEGYSPVSYFHGRAERGSALFAVEHNGATYHLANTSQVAEFKKNPTRYEPAFGGWCAFGMAVQDKFPVDPTNFKIVGGKIFLFLRNSGVDALKLWNGKSERDLLKEANAHWKKVQG